jgi:hypothetical protein
VVWIFVGAWGVRWVNVEPVAFAIGVMGGGTTGGLSLWIDGPAALVRAGAVLVAHLHNTSFAETPARRFASTARRCGGKKALLAWASVDTGDDFFSGQHLLAKPCTEQTYLEFELDALPGAGL